VIVCLWKILFLNNAFIGIHLFNPPYRFVWSLNVFSIFNELFQTVTGYNATVHRSRGEERTSNKGNIICFVLKLHNFTYLDEING
jgi:hypothetical protein